MLGRAVVWKSMLQNVLLVFLGPGNLGTDGVLGQDRKTSWTWMKMAFADELIPSGDKKKAGKPLRWWTLLTSLGASIASSCSKIRGF